MSCVLTTPYTVTAARCNFLEHQCLSIWLASTPIMHQCARNWLILRHSTPGLKRFKHVLVHPSLSVAILELQFWKHCFSWQLNPLSFNRSLLMEWYVIWMPFGGQETSWSKYSLLIMQPALEVMCIKTSHVSNRHRKCIRLHCLYGIFQVELMLITRTHNSAFQRIKPNYII